MVTVSDAGHAEFLNSGHPSDPDNLQLQTVEDAKRKDRIEVKPLCLVCSGQISLADARRKIRENSESTYYRNLLSSRQLRRHISSFGAL